MSHTFAVEGSYRLGTDPEQTSEVCGAVRAHDAWNAMWIVAQLIVGDGRAVGPGWIWPENLEIRDSAGQVVVAWRDGQPVQ